MMVFILTCRAEGETIVPLSDAELIIRARAQQLWGVVVLDRECVLCSVKRPLYRNQHYPAGELKNVSVKPENPAIAMVTNVFSVMIFARNPTKENLDVVI